MSETVHYKGTARKIDFSGCNLEEQADWLMGRGFDIDKLEYCEDRWVEDNRILCVGDDVYEILEEKEVDQDFEILTADIRYDGVIAFELRFYNGGASKAEAFGQALSKGK